jgi:hypothetical protein
MHGETFARVLERGLVYAVDVPVKKPGTQQLRVAVRDEVTGRVGSAFEHVAVPDVERGILSLSSIVLGDEPQGSDGAPDPVTSALRTFKRGATFEYSVAVYNAKRDKATKQPRLACQIRIYREGTLVETLDASPRVDDTGGAVLVRGALAVGPGLAPGSYVLELVVTDPLAGEKHRRTAQWIDFEVEW